MMMAAGNLNRLKSGYDFYLLDNHNKFIGTIDAIEAIEKKEINGLNTFEITIIESDFKARNGGYQIEKKDKIRVDFPEIYVNEPYRIYTVEGIQSTHRGSIITTTLYCEGIIYDLKNVYIDDRRFYYSDLSPTISEVLAGTNFEPVFLDDTSRPGFTTGFRGNKKIHCNFYRTNAYDALLELMNQGQVFIKDVRYNIVTKKFNVYFSEVNRWPTGETEYGIDISSVEKEVSEEGLVNVVYPLGNAPELETGGYGRKIQLNHDGKNYIEDTESINQYGRCMAVVDFDADTQEVLLAKAQEYLKLNKTPRVQYKFETQEMNLRDSKNIAIGSRVIVKDLAMGLSEHMVVKSSEIDMVSEKVKIQFARINELFKIQNN